MSNAPERIWANMEIVRFDEYQSRLPTNVNVEYIRADIADKRIAELEAAILETQVEGGCECFQDLVDTWNEEQT